MSGWDRVRNRVAKLRRWPQVSLLFLLSGAKFLIHLLLGGRYGYFRDELYFLDCGRHLAWGYVDHAPMIFGFAFVVGMLLTAVRREFFKPWIWIGGVIAVLIFLPNVTWQVQHNFPTLEDLHNVQASGKNVVLSPAAFIAQQIMIMHPILFPIWLAGLWFFLMGRGRKYSVLGWTYLMLLVEFIGLHGTRYYLAPGYPMLLAGGQWPLRIGSAGHG